MEHITIPRHALVVVCDGAKALLFRNEGDAELVNLKAVEHFAEFEAPAHDLGTDRPGRVYQSHGSARSAVETTDFHEAGEVEFLAMVAADLGKLVASEKPKGLFVVAPPKALGILRQHFGDVVRAALTAEIAKDLAHLPTNEIERHLTGKSTL
ncbi:protein required for attachment to host cells [Kaistia hirudinis]|uniref:Protein required for attachment to host cells n=1 Tax=Kaistia hirudinis TaxID=1293440 RepID=A0A840AMH9_9HYPH|nr:host attachment protein [Kaistia hirudinis]MBB3930538.1 protein required for attachment to host cells [Kaistia hirudinis]